MMMIMMMGLNPESCGWEAASYHTTCGYKKKIGVLEVLTTIMGKLMAKANPLLPHSDQAKENAKQIK